MTTLQINFSATWQELSQQLHEFNLEKGWWDKWLDDKFKRFPTAIMLVHTEFSEAVEGLRADLMDTHLPHLKMFDVEIADALIRLLDLAGALEVKLPHDHVRLKRLSAALRDLEPCEQISRAVATIGHYTWSNDPRTAIYEGIMYCLAIAYVNKIDLRSTLEEKTLYNMMRVDHKKENRELPNGKKF